MRATDATRMAATRMTATRPTAWIALLTLALLAAACTGGRARTGVLEPDGSARFALMDFGQPLDFDALPEGWSHRTFRRHAPMELRLVQKDGRDALRAATHDTASMLFRQVDVSLDHYPILGWEWLVTQGIDIDHDELTKADDDHPARLYLSFEGADGSSHALEIIWGNHKLARGDWKHLSYAFGLVRFPHFTANGGAQNVGRWHAEEVDLRELYREQWGSPEGARLTELAIFCDTDETGAQSIAFFSDLHVRKP